MTQNPQTPDLTITRLSALLTLAAGRFSTNCISPKRPSLLFAFYGIHLMTSGAGKALQLH